MRLSNTLCCVFTVAAAALLPAVPAVLALAEPAAEMVTATAAVAPAAVKPGGKVTLTLTVAIAPGYHINANKPDDENMIPTVFTAKAVPGVTFGKPVYPTPTQVTESYSPKPLKVYQGKAIISIPVTIARTAKPGRLSVGGDVEVQACNDTSCFPPKTLTVSAPVTVSR